MSESSCSLLDSLPVRMGFLDEQFCIVYLNRAFRQLLGLVSTEAYVEQTIDSFIVPDQKNALHLYLKAVETGTEVPTRPFQFVASDGIKHPLLLELKLHELDGIKGYWCVFHESDAFAAPEADFKLMVEHSRNIIALSDDQYKIIYVSPSCEAILHFSPEEVMGGTLTDFCHPEERDSFVQEIQNLWKGKTGSSHQEIRVQGKDGQYQWFEVHCYPLKKQSQVVAIQFSARMLESRKVQELRVRASELKYRRLIDNMDLGYLEVNEEGEVTFVNESFCRMTRYSAEELRGVNPESFLLPDMANREDINLRNNHRLDGVAEVYQMPIRRKDGVVRTLLISAAPLTDQNGKITGSAGIHWDITPLLEMEVRLYEKEVQRQRNMLQVSIRTEERQKQTLGRELHDGLGQLLAYISLNMQLLLDRNLNSKEIVEHTRSLLNNAITEVRQLARTLIPVALDTTKSLLEIITESLKHYANLKGLKYEIESYPAELDLKLSVDQKHVIFRILQELTNNTIKYAEASTVLINISIGTKNCTVDYRDDGKGFNMRKVKKGVGFESIQTRIDSYQGKIAIQSKPGKGIHVVFHLPFHKKLPPEQSLD